MLDILLLSCKLPALCVTCEYWFIGEVFPNKPGIVESHKCA